MKKFLAVIMLISVYSLALTGCFKAPQVEPEDQQPVQETAVQPDEEVNGGGGVAADETGADYPEAPATVAEKLDDFDKYGTGYAGDIIYGCNPEAEELNEKLKSGGILAVQLYESSFLNIDIYKTINPGNMTKEELEDTAYTCSELGSNQVLKVTEDYVMWGYPQCSAGALPDPELQPELYNHYIECVKVTNAVSDYLR